jgi:hypothetical protein
MEWRLTARAGVGRPVLNEIPIVSEFNSWTWNVHQSIIFYAARNPKLRAVADFLHPHHHGVASQVGHLIGIPRPVSGHNDVAFDSLTGSYGLVQQTIETVLIDVSGYRAEWVPSAVEQKINRPVKRCPGVSAPLCDDMVTRSVRQLRVRAISM